MKKQDILSLLQLYLAPVLVILLGLLLLVSPDSASVLVSRVLGWGLTAVGVISLVVALFSSRHKTGKLIGAGVLLLCGSVLAARPLLLASVAGRLIGVLLVMDGVSDMINAHRRGIRGLMPLIVTVLGVILVVLPMTASRLVFRLCGLAITVVGAVMLFDRIRHPRLGGSSEKPDVIDAL